MKLSGSLFLILSLSLLVTFVTSQNVLRNVFRPKQFVKKDEVLNFDVHPGQASHTFENVNYQIDSRVYQLREGAARSNNNIDNYQSDPNQYAYSEDCRIQTSQVILEKISVTNVTTDQIKAYHFVNDRVFILADNSISYYALSTDQPTSNPQLKMIGQLSNVSSTYGLDHLESKFFTMGNNSFVVDTEDLYMINVKEEGPTTSLNLTKITGYTPLSEYGQLIRVVAKASNVFIVLSNEAVTEYVCPRAQSCNKKPIVSSFKQSKHNFVDVGYIKGDIYLLEQTQGIFVQRAGVTDGTLQRYPLKFQGKFVKMQIIGVTMEVIGDYYGKRYVVQLLVHTNDEGLDDIVINRFYNQITGLRDVDFFDNKAIFIGDQQIMVIGHSINQRLLTSLSKKQNRQIYLSYGLLEFDVIESFSNPRKAFIVGISNKNLLIILLNQTAPSVVCDIKEDKSVYRLLVEFNTTNCGPFNWRDWKYSTSGAQNYCRVLESVNYHVTTPVSSKMSFALKVAALVICVAGILILTGLACKFRKIKFKLFRNLVEQIEKRRVGSQNSAQAI